MLNLETVGMERGMLYETIITSKNSDGTANAAPIGVICKNKDEIVVYLYEGSRTVENIKNESRFVVNILKDPVAFVQSTLGNLSSNYFKEHDHQYYIRNTEAFFIVEVINQREVVKKDQFGVSITTIVIARVLEIVKKQECVEPLNRAIYGIIEALVYLSRMGMVSGETDKVYRLRIKELSRIINKVGSLEHKKAMKLILEAYSE